MVHVLKKHTNWEAERLILSNYKCYDLLSIADAFNKQATADYSNILDGIKNARCKTENEKNKDKWKKNSKNG